MIYTWRCEDCGETAEVERVVDDYMLGPSENECACMCGAVRYNKIVSTPKLQPVSDGDKSDHRDLRYTRKREKEARDGRGKGRWNG